ncbi:MAG: 3-phosphoshikimate 1-carboxyvinyltransferase [Myxococcales bacterium]|nr:3-phosphoshikimate 1-carboxyvinyltransferase [Myxococcales bacterium]USN51630.1 MAG: 3-phosphoshikimate 1-carboxyvinyltransferase [Myxococcales bacterium]
MSTIKIYPQKNITGSTKIPGDKSISHRALMFAALAKGTSEIENLLEGHDCMATLQVMRALGVHIELKQESWLVHARGVQALLEPTSVLDCKNSGTTIRLMAGLLSAMPFMSILDGTDQIKSRPMDRVIEPLREMGAQIFGRAQNRLAPLAIVPGQLKGTCYELKVKSAQVKSALILAGLFASGETVINGTRSTRDHSERLLSFMGADIHVNDDSLRIAPLKNDLHAFKMKIPGDISSAAFLLAAGALLAESGIVLKEVGVNPTRTGIVDALRMMGASIDLRCPKESAHEPIADIHIKKSKLHGTQFFGEHVVRMIDEIPLLALIATQAHGATIIKDAQELKVKESNRITKTVELLSSLGADIKESDDGMKIIGPTPLKGGKVSSFGDHRLAMMMSIAGLIAQEPVVIKQAHVSDDSFPGFYDCISKLGGKAEVLDD